VILFRLYTRQGLGYFAKGSSDHRFPFLGGASLALRRQCVDEVGAFDPEMQLGEDSELTLRVLMSRWNVFSMDEAVSRHDTTYGFGTFLRKWFWHGYFATQIYRKHHAPAVEIFRRRRQWNVGQSAFECIYYSPKIPFRCLVFIDSFLIMHVAALLVLFSSNPFVRLPGAVVFGYSLFRYLQADLRTAPGWGALRTFTLRYLWNAMQILGGLYGSLRTRSFILNATV